MADELTLPGQTNLFGPPPDRFKGALEKYGVWPITVWDMDYQDRTMHALREEIGDTLDNSTRAGVLHSSLSGGKGKSLYDNSVSIFNPVLALSILKCFAPEGASVFDPFAGGGTRAILAAKRGHKYTGIELRQVEVDAVRERCARPGVADKVTLHQGDSRNAAEICGGLYADFLLTCPPYWNLEEYKGGAADLSSIHTYERFIDELGKVVAGCHACVRPGATCCWVVGLIREEEDDGPLRPFHHDLTRLHAQHGFRLREEVIIRLTNNGAIQRVGQFDKGRRTLVRVHEYLMVYTAK